MSNNSQEKMTQNNLILVKFINNEQDYFNYSFNAFKKLGMMSEQDGKIQILNVLEKAIHDHCSLIDVKYLNDNDSSGKFSASTIQFTVDIDNINNGIEVPMSFNINNYKYKIQIADQINKKYKIILSNNVQDLIENICNIIHFNKSIKAFSYRLLSDESGLHYDEGYCISSDIELIDNSIGIYKLSNKVNNLHIRSF